MARCVKAGINVVQQNLDAGLRMFADNMFDTVVLSQTLQAMRNVEAHPARNGARRAPGDRELSELRPLAARRLRCWRAACRSTKQIPYQWYDTPNIHLCTLKDFEILAARVGLVITGRTVLADGQPVTFAPALRATVAIYRFETR